MVGGHDNVGASLITLVTSSRRIAAARLTVLHRDVSKILVQFCFSKQSLLITSCGECSLYLFNNRCTLTCTFAAYRPHLFHKQKLWFPSKRIFVARAQALQSRGKPTESHR